MRTDAVWPVLDGCKAIGHAWKLTKTPRRGRKLGVSPEEHIQLCERVRYLASKGLHHTEITRQTGASRRMIYYYCYQGKNAPKLMNASNKVWSPEDKWHAGRQADAFFGLLDQYNKLLEEHNKLKEEYVRVCNSPQRGKPAGVVEPSVKAKAS